MINCHLRVEQPIRAAAKGWLQRLVRSHFSPSNTNDRDIEVYLRPRTKAFRKMLQIYDMRLCVMYRQDGSQLGIRVELRPSEKLEVTLTL